MLHKTCIFFLLIAVKPLVFTFQSGGQVDVGEDSTAKCTAMIGRPAPTITWLYDGQPIDATRMVITNRTRTPVQADETVTVSETLTIKKMRREDNKKGLQCLVEHELLDSPREIGTASMLVNCKYMSDDQIGVGFDDDNSQVPLY